MLGVADEAVLTLPSSFGLSARAMMLSSPIQQSSRIPERSSSGSDRGLMARDWKELDRAGRDWKELD